MTKEQRQELLYAISALVVSAGLLGMETASIKPERKRMDDQLKSVESDMRRLRREYSNLDGR